MNVAMDPGRMCQPARLAYSAGLVLLLVCASVTAGAQELPRVVLEVEAGSTWLARNDVQIPNEEGTRFSLSDLIGAGPSPIVRLQATWHINDRHSVRGVYAPVLIEAPGTPATPLLFAGTGFDAGQPLDATYQFTSYRLTYRYRIFQGDTWTWRIGATAFVRDARVALAQGGREAEDTDVGFVPLGHVAGEARLGGRWTLLLDLDITAAPQGRAIDFGGRVQYALSDRWAVGGGYRTIEGGADVERVFNFAWLNAAVATLAVRF
jgi:hypothetical protein